MNAAFAENNTCDTVSFYRKKIFCGKDETAVEYIERGDSSTLRYYVLKYMDTSIYVTHPPPRPPTPRLPPLKVKAEPIKTYIGPLHIVYRHQNIPGNWR